MEIDPPEKLHDKSTSRSAWREQLQTSRLLMSTGDSYNAPISHDDDNLHSPPENNYFRSCQWSPDGTTLLTTSADNVLRSFILPPDLLEKSSPKALTPYHEHTPPAPVYATTFHPSFNLAEPSTAIYLASLPDLPIRLISPFSPKSLATYALVNPNSEAFVAPHSILFDTYASHETTHFLTGHDSQISIFDLNRPGEPPHTTLKTIPSKRKKLVGGGVGMKGLISTMAMSPDGLLVAGTFTRWVGLYDGGGRGSEVGVFQLGRDQGDRDGIGGGSGVTQIVWSNDGKYLVVAERMSEGLSIWDVRGTGRRLAWLKGRNAGTMQRMSIDIVDDAVIAGDVHGNVNMWGAIGTEEGVVDAMSKVKLHEDAISSAVMHPSAAVLATCSGQRHERRVHITSDDASDVADIEVDIGNAPLHDPTIDNSLKIWSLYSDLRHGEDGESSGP